jgi:hypothetical protein
MRDEADISNSRSNQVQPHTSFDERTAIKQAQRYSVTTQTSRFLNRYLASPTSLLPKRDEEKGRKETVRCGRRETRPSFWGSKSWQNCNCIIRFRKEVAVGSSRKERQKELRGKERSIKPGEENSISGSQPIFGRSVHKLGTCTNAYTSNK